MRAPTATAVAFEATFLAMEEMDAAVEIHAAGCASCSRDFGLNCEVYADLAEAQRTAAAAHVAACEASRAAYRVTRGRAP